MTNAVEICSRPSILYKELSKLRRGKSDAITTLLRKFTGDPQFRGLYIALVLYEIILDYVSGNHEGANHE